ncbi:NPP1 family protein [Labedaea rhizosphaerae]|uniref:Necrosis inducing protein (NPP1) n=1 Tax=Labedaea rhizosphaerae TaxID=598644 RepID=A0A4R6S5H4_LABRH|nr:NPP1 family protein [Labedaea rhizosphaerae]TDP94911.1 necrosis inducing protein (NPP1) [Labedaea rhizosphaerae]
MGSKGFRALGWTAVPVAAVAVLGLVVGPGVAWADPPRALPTSAPADDAKWQPALDFDTDGCYSTPAIGPDGTLNPGLNLGGAVNGNCHDASDLVNTNTYSRSKCNNGWCAYMYSYYFEKDQALPGPFPAGHKHDWEDVVVWVQNDQARYLSVSQHGGYQTGSTIQFAAGTHPKAVYHKDGISTHCFRFPKADGGDEPPENAEHTWQIKGLVGWNNYPAGIRDKLTAADFGDATLKITDARFGDALSKAKPAGIPFNPYG